MHEQNEICGECRYHCRANLDGDWVCENPESNREGEWTDYDDGCENWEGRK